MLLQVFQTFPGALEVSGYIKNILKTVVNMINLYLKQFFFIKKMWYNVFETIKKLVPRPPINNLI